MSTGFGSEAGLNYLSGVSLSPNSRSVARDQDAVDVLSLTASLEGPVTSEFKSVLVKGKTQ